NFEAGSRRNIWRAHVFFRRSPPLRSPRIQRGFPRPRLVGTGRGSRFGEPPTDPRLIIVCACETAHTPSPVPSVKSGSSTCRQEAKMAQGPRSGFRLGIILAMAVILVAITTWEVSRNNLKSASAGSIPPSEVIYRSQHLNLF